MESERGHMRAQTYRILIGATGWLHPGWQDSFYPVDLPDDWKIAFYGNEFPVVLVPADVWETGPLPVQEWLDNCEQSFSFLLELPVTFINEIAIDDASGRSRLADVTNTLSSLGEHCLGLVLPGKGVADDRMQRCCEKLRSICPLVIDEGSDEKTRNLVINCTYCWHGDGEKPHFETGQLALIRIIGKQMDMKALRRVMETGLKNIQADQSLILIFDDPLPDIEQMENAGILLDLL